MPNLLQLFQGSKAYGSKVLFKKASFSLNEGEHVGVIGSNGAGKTTLFKILTRQEPLDSGELTQARGLRIGFLAQQEQWNKNETVEEFLSQECLMPLWDIKALGLGLGLTEAIYAQSITSLSGGFRMRCKLLRLLSEEPDLLLLDEPTNYLDLESLLALEKFLQEYKRTFLLISHDREFLRRTTDHILEIEEGAVTKFNGSLDDYFMQKDLLSTQLAARALSLDEKRKEILDFVARFGAKATKAAQAQSRLKSLDRLEKIEIKTLPKTVVVHLPEPIKTGKLIASLKEVHLGYGNKIILNNINLSLERGHHLAVVGINGAGKSTLLKALAAGLEPLQGTIQYGYQVSIGYYSQHVSEALEPSKTVFQEMTAKAHPEITPQQVLNLAGALLFSGSDVKKPISILSGGEKSRVALGQILLQKAPFLLLDEPTNHLDFQTVEILTEALAEYTGTLVVVSHDRSFIRRVGNKILEIHNGKVEYYPGTYDEYVWSCQRGMLAAHPMNQKKTDQKKIISQQFKNFEKSLSKNEAKKIFEKDLRLTKKKREELEEKLGWQQSRMGFLNEKLVTHPQHPDLQNWVVELGQLQQELDKTESQWVLLSEKIESLEKKSNT